MHVVHRFIAPGRIQSCCSCMTAATSTVNKIYKYFANAWSRIKNEMVQFRKGRRSLTLITVSWSQGTYVNHSVLVPGYDCPDVDDLSADAQLLLRHLGRLARHVQLRAPRHQRHVTAWQRNKHTSVTSLPVHTTNTPASRHCLSTQQTH